MGEGRGGEGRGEGLGRREGGGEEGGEGHPGGGGAGGRCPWPCEQNHMRLKHNHYLKKKKPINTSIKIKIKYIKEPPPHRSHLQVFA